MSTGEEQELLAQINRLEGRIHRHKQHRENHRTLFPRPSSPSPPSLIVSAPQYSRGTYRSTPYPRGGAYRGSRGHAPTYRNKTLVLNGGLNGQARPEANSNNTNNGSWVSRTDRHLQLINSSVFEKDSQARVSAIEETQRQKRLQKEQLEKVRFLSYAQQNASNVLPTPSNANATSASSRYEITVEGIRFQITKQGSKLVRAPGTSALTLQTVPLAILSNSLLTKS